MSKKLWWLLVPLALILAFVVFFMLLAKPVGVFAFWKKNVVGPSTVVTIERVFICGEREVLSEGPAPKALIKLDAKGIKRRFPEEAGWNLDIRLPAVVRMAYAVQDFCPQHKSYRHIGLKDGYVAVFEGPLGFNQKVLRIERHLPEATLTPGLHEKLLQGMNFGMKPSEIQAQLRRELEFAHEAQLNAALENLDELQE